MGWTINETTVNRYLSDFGYTESDIVNGGNMIDGALYPEATVKNWMLTY